MAANGLGAFGAFVVITALSCFLSLVSNQAVFNKVLPVASDMAKQLPAFTVSGGKLNMPNVGMPFVKLYDNAVVVIDPNGKSITNDMVKRYNKPWVIMVSDKINIRAAQSGRYAFIALAAVNGMNNQNVREHLHKAVVTTEKLLYVVILLMSIVGRGALALFLAGILSLIKIEGTAPIYSVVLKIVTHAMIPGTLLQMVCSMLYTLQFSVTRSTDASGLSTALFLVCTLAISIIALYKAQPEVSSQ